MRAGEGNRVRTGAEKPAETRKCDSRLARYRPVLDDWQAFLAAQDGAALPVVLSVNRSRISADALSTLLAEGGFAPRALAWTDAAIALPPRSRPALHWTYAAGLFHVQEEASQLPLALLDAQPGERVLDICAAPGGKAAQLCQDVGPQGTVVANDRDGRRLTAVRDRMKRLGLTNLVTTVHDGASLPAEVGLFDRVLVDAPCSGEGNPSQGGAGLHGRRQNFESWLVGTQRALLRRALSCLKPGGRLVYSTCSLAPEEDEGVVDWLIRSYGDALRLLPACLPGLKGDPGLSAWEGRAFHPEVAKCLRLWPQRTGTGGFFAMALEKRGGETFPATPPPDLPEPAPEAVEILPVLRHHFGLPEETLSDLRVIAKGPEYQVIRKTLALPERPRPASLGVPLARRAAAFPKPTTAAALLFGRQATRNVLEASAGDAADYLARRSFRPAPGRLIDCDRQGYVLVRRKGYPLGVALLRHTAEGGPVLDSQYPLAWSRSFA